MKPCQSVKIEGVSNRKEELALNNFDVSKNRLEEIRRKGTKERYDT